MTAAIQTAAPTALAGLDAKALESLMSGGDCSKLSPDQRNAYYLARCEAAGLDPRAAPFQFVRLSGREVLYATKGAADQLAAKHGLRTSIVSQATEDGIRVVTVRVEAKDGRATEEIGALTIKGLTGEALSNALMKCVTKAKRRAVLSICGLGMMDESEVDSIPGAVHVESKPAPARMPVVEEIARAQHKDEAEEAVEDALEVAEHSGDAFDLWGKLEAERPQTAGVEWQKAAQTVFGGRFPPAKTWTAEQTESVARILFPPANP